MKTSFKFQLVITLMLAVATSHAFGAGVVRIAPGDCNALSAAAASAPGQEPALILLAREARYATCELHVKGSINIDGGGARLSLAERPTGSSQIAVEQGGRLSLSNLNIVLPAQDSAAVAAQSGPKAGTTYYDPSIRNDGSLLLDSVSISQGSIFRPGKRAGGLFDNSGALTLRNVTLTNNYAEGALIGGSGSVDISHSTLSGNYLLNGLFGPGLTRVANSVLSDNQATCGKFDPIQVTSLGGNVSDDPACPFTAANDRLANDLHFLDYSGHGGVVDTFALNFDSPAVGNGVAANCEASDARGLSRGATACDSGAYEVGAGDGKLSKTGMSGLYFNAANNGHYVSIQKLYGDQSLVIWNTFDEQGVPAWLYGVGRITGNKIHVEQVAQNVGGTLHAGGGVTGSTPTLWGTLDVDLSDCYNASLSYDSLFPTFGSGSTALQRLVFLDGVDCAR